MIRIDGIPVRESQLLPADSWGHWICGSLGYVCGVIFTPDIDRLRRNLDQIGIDRRTGEIRLMGGKVER